MSKKSKEKWKVYKNVFDEFTLRTLFKLSTQGHYKDLESPICIGKEANVFTAKTEAGDRVIVKIYRLESCDFNKMYDYIKYDPRYQHLRKQRRKIIFAWTQREYRNLLKAREAGVKVPKPIAFLNNVLIEEFVGNNQPAQKLKDLEPKDKKKFAKETVSNMKKLFKAKLVHGDLSEFNILNHNNQPVFIDFSQCSPIKSPLAKELLDRDIKNIVRFFNKKGLKLKEKNIKKQIIKE